MPLAASCHLHFIPAYSDSLLCPSLPPAICILFQPIVTVSCAPRCLLPSAFYSSLQRQSPVLLAASCHLHFIPAYSDSPLCPSLPPAICILFQPTVTVPCAPRCLLPSAFYSSLQWQSPVPLAASCHLHFIPAYSDSPLCPSLPPAICILFQPTVTVPCAPRCLLPSAFYSSLQWQSPVPLAASCHLHFIPAYSDSPLCPSLPPAICILFQPTVTVPCAPRCLLPSAFYSSLQWQSPVPLAASCHLHFIPAYSDSPLCPSLPPAICILFQPTVTVPCAPRCLLPSAFYSSLQWQSPVPLAASCHLHFIPAYSDSPLCPSLPPAICILFQPTVTVPCAPRCLLPSAFYSSLQWQSPVPLAASCHLHFIPAYSDSPLCPSLPPAICILFQPTVTVPCAPRCLLPSAFYSSLQWQSPVPLAASCHLHFIPAYSDSPLCPSLPPAICILFQPTVTVPCAPRCLLPSAFYSSLQWQSPVPLAASCHLHFIPAYSDSPLCPSLPPAICILFQPTVTVPCAPRCLLPSAFYSSLQWQSPVPLAASCHLHFIPAYSDSPLCPSLPPAICILFQPTVTVPCAPRCLLPSAFYSSLQWQSPVPLAALLSCCFTSTEARWPIRDGALTAGCHLLFIPAARRCKEALRTQRVEISFVSQSHFNPMA